MQYREIIAVCCEIEKTHSDTVYIIFVCFFLLVHKVTTGMLRAYLYLQMVDNLPEVLSGNGEAHAVSMFR